MATMVGPVSDASGSKAAQPFANFDLPARYKPQKQVGKGSFGVLIAAWDEQSSEKVAIKKIACTSRMGWDRMQAKSLLRELRLLQHFDHENIMRARDVLLPASSGLSPNGVISDIYLVQDLMATDLHFIIQSAARGQQRLTNDHVQYFLYQLLRGLHACHSANVLHRDLKPGNLLVNKDCELRIADFGLARGVDANPAEAAHLTEYVVTRWYRAPELLTGNESYDRPVDMWSVGCILAEMLGLQAIFPGTDTLMQLRLVIGGVGVPSDLSFISNPKAIEYIKAISQSQPAPPPLASRFPGASPLALDLLQRLLVFDPSQRLSTGEALCHPYLASLNDINDAPAGEKFDFSFELATDAQLRDLLLDEVRRFNPNLPLVIDPSAEPPTTPSPPTHILPPPPSTPGAVGVMIAGAESPMDPQPQPKRARW
mmetsp:Transcript_22601/g.45367  ORF Transcript_22601/g.45367 Transcript_22601/m.45367 type:complete len:427 (-) Transcript_22601:507-1787(-)